MVEKCQYGKISIIIKNGGQTENWVKNSKKFDKIWNMSKYYISVKKKIVIN